MKSDIGNIKIAMISGDITLVNADAIITAINSGRYWDGGIDRAIRMVAGDMYHNQAKPQKLSDLKVIVAKGNRNHHVGKFDNVVFVVDDLKSKLRNVIANGLEGADNAGFKKVSIPAIRTGIALGFVEKSFEEVVEEYILGIKIYVSDKIKNGKTPGIETIEFITYNDSELDEILRYSLKNEGWL